MKHYFHLPAEMLSSNLKTNKQNPPHTNVKTTKLEHTQNTYPLQVSDL